MISKDIIVRLTACKSSEESQKILDECSESYKKYKKEYDYYYYQIKFDKKSKELHREWFNKHLKPFCVLIDLVGFVTILISLVLVIFSYVFNTNAVPFFESLMIGTLVMCIGFIMASNKNITPRKKVVATSDVLDVTREAYTNAFDNFIFASVHTEYLKEKELKETTLGYYNNAYEIIKMCSKVLNKDIYTLAKDAGLSENCVLKE